MVSLVWRGTFIDVEDSEAVPEKPRGARPRARSEPREKAGASDIFESERSYVAGLAKNFAPAKGSAVPEPEAKAAEPGTVPNHFVKERRNSAPAVFFEPLPEPEAFEKNRVVSSMLLFAKVDGESMPATNGETDTYASTSSSTSVAGGSPVAEPLSPPSSVAWRSLAAAAAAPLSASSSVAGGSPVAAASAAAAASSGEPTPSATTASMCNTGSVGHPILCSRPCLYVASGECAHGAKCEFCHMEHTRRMPHLNKVHREQLRDMEGQKAKAMILPLVREKALIFDNSPETARAVDDLARACGVLGATRVQRSKDEQKLFNVLNGMTVRLLLIILQRSVLQEEPGAHDAAEALLSHLRNSVIAAAKV